LGDEKESRPKFPAETSVLVNGSGARDVELAEAARMRHPAFRVGSVIADKYIVERVIGEGGLGVVVSAHHQHLEQTVAIKYLRPKVLGSKVVTDRFLREARLAAKIRSEHVVRVFDVGIHASGVPYMIMEHLEGTDLGHVLVTSGPLVIERAVDYVLQACEALAEAHVAGIVHRDLKPDNLFLATVSGKSTVKVLDFGISKMSSKRSDTGRLSELTEANDQFGTPVYMSPEQLRSASDVDTRADVWAVGVILFELLSGQLPFDAPGLPELCTAILNLPPASLTDLRPSLPESLEAVVERCLAKDPDQRFQNVAELAQELRSFASAAGRQSVDHVVRVVRDGGEVVRPSTPTAGEASARVLREARTLAPSESRSPESRTALTTSSAATSWGSIRIAPPGPRRKVVLLATAGVGLLVAVGVTLVRATATSEVAAARASPEITVSGSATAVVPLAPRASDSPSAPTEASPSAASAPLSVAPPRGPSLVRAAPRSRPNPGGEGPRQTARPVAAAAGSSTTPAAAPFDPNAVINPFQ
jgi:serine/threonine-protein kinase